MWIVHSKKNVNNLKKVKKSSSDNWSNMQLKMK